MDLGAALAELTPLCRRLLRSQQSQKMQHSLDLVVELLEFAGDARLRVQVEDDEEEAWEEGAKDHGEVRSEGHLERGGHRHLADDLRGG